MQQESDGRRVCAACGYANSHDRRSCKNWRQPLAATDPVSPPTGGAMSSRVWFFLGLVFVAVGPLAYAVLESYVLAPWTYGARTWVVTTWALVALYLGHLWGRAYQREH